MTDSATMPYLRPALVTAASASLFGLFAASFAAIAPWAIDRSGSLWEPLRGGARGWLIAHGSGLETANADVRIVPLGATLAVMGLIVWVTAKTVVDPVKDVVAFVFVTALMYAAGAGILSALTQTNAVSTSMWRAVVGAFVIAALGSAIGLALAHDGVRTRWAALEVRHRAVVHAAGTGALAILGSALVLVVLLLAANRDRALDLWTGLQPGLLGGIALALLCLALLPNLVLWAASALVGPGFVLGTNTSIDLTGAHLGSVPSLPLLAALPDPGRFPGWTFGLMLLPVAAGMAAGWRFQSLDDAGRGTAETAVWGAVSGVIAGLTVGVLIAISGGAIGPGRMADIGPPLLTPLLAATATLALGGAIGAVLGHYRVARATART